MSRAESATRNQEGPLLAGLSTCPNDTFAFAALLEGRVPAPALEFVLGDVEALNRALLGPVPDAVWPASGTQTPEPPQRQEPPTFLRHGQEAPATILSRPLALAKCSLHAALHLTRDFALLPAGAALGFGVGPLLLAADPRLARRLPAADERVLCPGRWTTASLLYRLYCPAGPAPRQTVFSEIMGALSRGEADYGVVIHEGRFTYKQRGLYCAADLGACWEKETGLPLPLGGIVARKDLGPARLAELARAIRASLEAARRDPASARTQMRAYAQECDEEALWEHVRLYVTEATLDLGTTGRGALAALQARALDLGMGTPAPLEHVEF